MRKSLWIIPALFMVAAIVAPSVRADTVTFTCPGDPTNPAAGNPCFVAAPTAPDVTFSTLGTTLDITWNSQTFDLTLPGDWSDTDANVVWGASNGEFIAYDPERIIDPEGNFEPEPFTLINTSLPNGAGISEGGPLTFTPGTVAAPEPGTSVLMLLGIGALLVTRKRIGRGLPKAA